MYLTWLDSNSWLIEMAGQRILLDPWLVGPLMFGNQAWLFKGERTQPRPIPENLDLILLSQGLEDHAHPPTLRQLDRSIPVVGSAGAAKVAAELGFEQVTTLLAGQTTTAGSLEIRATPGTPMGPQVRENGYLLTDLSAQTRLYYEPHGFHSPELKALAPVDVVITPLVSLDVLFAPFIRGGKSALQAVQWLQPQVIMSTAAGGAIEFAGVLMQLLRVRDGVEEFRQLLSQENLSTQVLEPQPGERFAVPLQPRVKSSV